MARVSFAKALTCAAIACVVIGFAWHVSQQPMDFRVYHFGARGVFDGTRPVYGRSSGLGWPMHYRYPPVFLLLFAPFAWLPLGISAALWLVFKAMVLLVLIRSIAKRFPSPESGTDWLVPILLAGPFVIQDFRYGNAQFFIFALTAFGLLLARENPIAAGSSLGLAIAVKVWPLFFVPYLIVSRRLKTAAYSLLFAAVLTLLPSVYFGVRGNASLIGQWFRQEFATQTGQEEIWFPSQSIRGVMMRYLTAIDYSQVPDSNYPSVNIAHINPAVVRTLWFIVAGTAYLAFLWFASKQHAMPWANEALGFCLVALLQPFTQKYALVVLLFPAIVAARIKPGIARNLVYLSIALVLIQPIISGAANQRLMQTLGLDFAATLLLGLALTFLPSIERRTAEP